MLRALALTGLCLALGAAGCASADAPTVPADAAPQPSGAAPEADGPVRLGVGESAAVGGQTLRFVEVVEDSRCPQGVQCIQAGRAQIRVAVGADEAVLTAPHEPMRDGEAVSAVLGGLEVTFEALDPYPGSAEAQAGAPVTATLAVQ